MNQNFMIFLELKCFSFQTKIIFKYLIWKKGFVPEFINPKYADETRNKFKSSTRLECLMQHIPKLVKHGEKVCYTYFAGWFFFSAIKNNLYGILEKLNNLKG